MRFATWESAGRSAAGVVGEHGLRALPGTTTVLDLVRAGLPAALEAGAAALDNSSPTPVDSVRLLPPLDPPTVRDFAAFEERVEGVVRSVSGGGASLTPEEARDHVLATPSSTTGPRGTCKATR